MNEALFLRRDGKRRGGFTLIEVVIALAIFLFGAVAIIRIFPGALGVIQNSGDQLTATNLNRSNLAKFEKSPGLLPDAIYDDATATPFAGAVVGTALRNASLPRHDIQDFENTALGHFKTISRETHTVVVSGNAPPAAYVVTQYPYDPSQPVLIYNEGTVDGVVMNANGTLDFADAKLHSDGSAFKDPASNLPPTDYRNSNTNSPTVNDTVFYVSYNWVENNSIQSVVDEPLFYSPNGASPAASTQTVQGRRSSPTIAPVAGPVQVRFRRLKYRPFPPAPTQNTLKDEDTFRGVIDLSLPTAPNNFVGGETISIDYTRKDWRWLVNDDSPSVKPEGAAAADNFRVTTSPVRFLDKQQPIYTFLVNQAGLTSSGMYNSGTTTGTNFPPTTFGDPVNFKTGQVVFDFGPNTTAARSRVTYQTLDNWTHQLSIAARSYKPFYSAALATNPPEPWRDYVYNSSTLYFRPSEAGKSVSISYTYNKGTPTDVQVTKRVLQISQDIISSTASNGGVAVGGMVSQLALTDNNGDPLTGSDVKGIQGVRGASIQSRTAWIDNNKFTQVSSVSFRDVNN